MMRIKQKIFSILIISIFFIDLASVGFAIIVPKVSGADVAPPSDVGKAVISSDLVSLSPKYIQIGSGAQKTLESGGIYTIPGSGGQIRTYKAPAVYILPEGVDMELWGTDVDENGNKTAIYRALIPVEFDYNIYTSFGQANVNPFHKLPTVSTDAQDAVCVGRVYVGDSGLDADTCCAGTQANSGLHNLPTYDPSKSDISFSQDETGVVKASTSYNNILFNDAVGAVKGRSYFTDPWMYRAFKGVDGSTSTYSLAGSIDYKYWVNCGFLCTSQTGKDTYTFTHGNDDNPNFRTEEPTQLWTANIPYVLLGDASKDGNSIEDSPYNTQRDALITYMIGPEVDIGSFSMGWDLNIQPLRGIRDKIQLDTKGNVILSKTKTKVAIKDAFTLSGTGESNRDAYGFVNDALTGQLADAGTHADPSIDTPKTSTAPQPPAKTVTKGSVTITSPNPILFNDKVETNPDLPSTQTEAVIARPSGDLTLISKNAGPTMGKNIDAFTTDDFDAYFNYTTWDLRFEGYHLRPAVGILKRSIDINYQESWIDVWRGTGLGGGVLAETKYILFNAGGSATPRLNLLAGWNAKNVYIHQRVRLTLEVISTYVISVKNNIDGEDLSGLNNQNDDYLPGFIDLNTTGTTQYGRNFEGTGITDTQLTIDIVLIAIVAVAVIGIVIYIRGRSLIGGGGGGPKNINVRVESKAETRYEGEKTISRKEMNQGPND